MSDPAAHIRGLLARAKPYTTESEGCALVWHCWPAKQAGALPLLLVHGGFGAWTHWAANIEALSEHFQVWTVDMPGLGDSGDLPDPVSVHHIAKLLWSGWRELQGGNAFELAGFSFGAMVAGRLAAVAGGSCRRCSLIGAVGFGQLQVQVDLLAPPAVGSEGAEAIHRENLGRLMIHDQALIDPLAVYIHSNNLARSRLRSRGIAVTNELAECLHDIQADLVGIWGEFDATAGGAANIERRRELFQAAQPGSQFHVLPAVGHWAMYEAPVAVNRLLLD